ncbi:MAG: ubiquinol-cytochrome c reductase iron-sulfur subunit [Coleofasciculaceae cyanobacterium]
MNRREFLMWVGVGGVAGSLPVALVACNPKSEKSESAASPPNAEGFQSVGTVAELNQKGQIFKKEFAKGGLIVVSNPTDAKTILAVNPTCTHQGCTVEWKQDEKSFVCPCHGAKYSAQGKVLREPALQPLQTYEAKIQGDTVLVKVI